MSEAESDLLCPPEKSPLCTPWSFWFDKKILKENPTAADYRNNMNLLGTFDTVEDFWRHFIHIQSGSNLPNHCNVYMFRNADLPSWERWPAGGCWILKVKRKQGVLNKLWQDLVFACIGEEFQQYGVVGVMLASRKNLDMLSVWCARSDTRDRFHIGEKLKLILHLDVGAVLDYKRHQNSIQDGSSFKNAQSFVFAKKDGQSKSAPKGKKAKARKAAAEKAAKESAEKAKATAAAAPAAGSAAAATAP
eukprot:INCI8073.1.p1 GENE.INCI8073.1~~INCI8073.1.p1  ORF type:complete len:290 (-),score=54.47 INCI8073.1:252-995(-)